MSNSKKKAVGDEEKKEICTLAAQFFSKERRGPERGRSEEVAPFTPLKS